MKTLIKRCFILAFCLLTSDLCLSQTPCFYSGELAPGVPQTNYVVFQSWPPPPSGANWISIGTNTVYVGSPFTNTPNTVGSFSNVFWPTTYKVSIPALGSGAFFYVKIPDTASYESLNLYATNIVTATTLTSYQIITNLLGYTPAPATTAGIIAALGYTPPTNSYSSLTNSLGLIPAAVTDPRLVLAVTNLSNVGVADAAPGWIVTNGFTAFLSLKTNGVPGNAWTNLPQGSICTTTNGATFVLSNLVWRPQ